MNLQILPLEIEDYIWNMYWAKFFKDNVINYLNDIKEIVENINKNVSLNEVVKFTNEKDKLIYLNKYNNLILSLGFDKGTLKFSVSIDKNLFFSFHKNRYLYIQYKKLEHVNNYINAKSKIFSYN